MRPAWTDLRHALRILTASPSFATAAVLSLALGIGATTAIFSAADALLLRPLPYRDAGRIAIIWQRSPGLNVPQDWLSPGQYLDIAAEAKSFSSVAAAINSSFNLTGTDNNRPERVDGVRASSSLFTVFGARAALGRLFNATDDTPGGEQDVILTDHFWRARFGADPNVLGKTLTLNGHPYPIVGVLAPDFAFDREVMPTVNTIGSVNFILPLPFPASARTQRHHEDFDVFVKLEPGVTLAGAQAELDGIAARMKAQYPKMYPPNGGLTLSAVPLLDQVVGDARLALYVLLGASGLLLLIACGNVANLLLARAEVREREVAVRAAIGASRGRIVRQLLGESLVLASVGGVVGVALAFVGVRMIRAMGEGTVPRAETIAIDARVLGFAVLVSVLTAVVFGLVPALRSARVDPHTVLKEGGRTGAGGGHARLRATLVAAEVALSVMLLIGAGLLVRSYGRVLDADPGFNPDRALSFRLSLPRVRYGTPEAVNGFYRQLDERLRALPGVVDVGTNYQLPLSSVSLAWEPIDVEGYVPPSPADDRIITSSAYIGGAYFRAMGISLIAGRSFTEHDTPQSPPVVVVDDHLARRFWPNQSPIGKRIRQNATGRWCTVVGVVANTRQWAPVAQPPITVYFAVAQYGIASQFVVVRTAR
ncbi:MAG TPA: ABC transporter permease, partial [Gemmatimonadales bacterium]|nr:ABC transporter permease [Gemmatimonadales bacterium]